MNKGDKVKIKAICQGITTIAQGVTRYKMRSIQRIEAKTNLTGIVIGYSFIPTGKYNGWENDDYFPIIYQPTFHKVWNVSLLTNGNRYLRPVKCFEEDLEKVL